MTIQTRPHIQDNGCKLTPSFKKYFNKDFIINSLSKIAKRKDLKDIIYHVEDFIVQNFAATFFENFDFVIENLQFISMQILQLTCFPLNFRGKKKRIYNVKLVKHFQLSWQNLNQASWSSLKKPSIPLK